MRRIMFTSRVYYLADGGGDRGGVTGNEAAKRGTAV